MKKAILLMACLVVVVMISGCIGDTTSKSDVKKFSSYDEMKSYLKANSNADYGYGGMRTMGEVATAGVSGLAPSASTSDSASSYSTTNIQVEGVDEADIVKNDGKYIYTVSNGAVYIVDAYPAENAKILSNISGDGSIQNIFINGDKLTVFGQNPYVYAKEVAGLRTPYYNSQTSFIRVYDVSDRSNPVLVRNLTVDGSYYDSRMIGDYAYVILSQHFYYQEDQPIPLPRVITPSEVKTTDASEVYYLDGAQSNSFTIILAVNTQDQNEEITQKVYLMDYGQTIYASQQNIYIVYPKIINQNVYNSELIDIVIGEMPGDVAGQMREIQDSNTTVYEKQSKIGKIFYNYSNTLSNEARQNLETKLQEKLTAYEMEIQKERYKTTIQKIAVNGKDIEYVTQGEVPGYVLNQFSMDENGDYFRIATTIPRTWSAQNTESKNNVYILGGDLQITGKLEDLAPGERIYSARFIGNRCYLVTFKQVDPLFVIDTDPINPRVLGQLKIPGYSDYLHPYDETHIIGIGKEATDQGTFAWYQGVKLALFDVSDVANPIEVSNYSIGHRGTNSEALYDHKAFLFDREKNLLVIPITLAEVDQSKYPDGVPARAHGQTVWQGAYVFDLSVDNGFVLKGRITHNDTDANYWSYYGPYSVKRSLYMDDTLYTISNRMIKMNSLNNMSEINKIEFPYTENYYGYEYGGDMRVMGGPIAVGV